MSFHLGRDVLGLRPRCVAAYWLGRDVSGLRTVRTAFGLWPASRPTGLLHHDGLDLLEAGALHLVDEDQAAGHVTLVVEGERDPEDALVVLRGAHGVPDGRPVGLAD